MINSLLLLTIFYLVWKINQLLYLENGWRIDLEALTYFDIIFFILLFFLPCIKYFICALFVFIPSIWSTKEVSKFFRNIGFYLTARTIERIFK